jgi:RimJ/RimL family protein N-acetyltransferase
MLVSEANDERVPVYLSNMFPHPYTATDADWWIARCSGEDPPVNFAIVVDGRVAGGLGAVEKQDIYAGTAELGWWTGVRWWGRGITALAVRGFIRYCFEDLDLHRVEAGVMAPNGASARVAEKAGLEREGVARDGYLKGGRRMDRLLYGLVRGDPEQSR